MLTDIEYDYDGETGNRPLTLWQVRCLFPGLYSA